MRKVWSEELSRQLDVINARLEVWARVLGVSLEPLAQAGFGAARASQKMVSVPSLATVETQ